VSQSSFAILEKISESSTTTVYRAHQSVLDRTVLLKVLHKHLLRDKNLVSRFSREAKACAILQCENIVQVYDLTEIDGAPAIVMEYVEGKSLEEMLLDGEYSGELMMRVAESVLNALSYAHGRGVVHRDIKPGNILVSKTGVIKVTDFGLASVSDAPSLTMEGGLIGTPAYMSPEQARGEVVDGRTDLFSLGITLIETLTGEKIFLGDSYAECLNRIRNFQPDSIEKYSEKLSPTMLEFLKRLLASDRDARFSSAEEAINFLNSTSGQGRVIKRVGRLIERRRSMYIIAAFIVMLAFGSFLAYVVISSTEKKLNGAKKTAADTSSQDIAEKNPLRDGTSAIPRAIGDSKKKIKLTGTSLEPTVSRLNKGADSPPTTLPDSGYISITCNPWADVNIDSEYVGKTPLSGSVKFPAGRHVVTFTNPIFVPIVKEIEVEPKDLATVNADFFKNAGYVYVTVVPWGDVYIDDLKRDTTPLSKPIIASAGTRRLRIHNPSFRDIIQNLKVVPGDTLRLNFNFLSKN
jgi:serine/threonine protein kinase